MNRLRYSATLLLLAINFSMVKSQFISGVLEYVPAPGQFINSGPWGTPSSAASIVGKADGTLCLGSYGGYVVFRFGQPVENHPDNPFGVDFTIFGNPLEHWSEPGVVWVMKDENGNGSPDDTWYELAGSDYHFSSSSRNYQVTYTNPGDSVARDVPWSDNEGQSGILPANNVHLQTYYPHIDSFPSIPRVEYTLGGSSIEAVVGIGDVPGITSRRRSFGYADNQVRGSAPYTLPDNPYTVELENSGGDAMDIDWAVDSHGNYVTLDRIHFVKVQNAVHSSGGWVGELSTEITGAVDVAADGSITGEEEVIVIRDLPPEIEGPAFQLEAFVYNRGRLQPGAAIDWSSQMDGTSVDGSGLLTVQIPGELVLTAALAGRPEIRCTVTTRVRMDGTWAGAIEENAGDVLPFPNPAHSYTKIAGVRRAAVSFYDAAGRCMLHLAAYDGESPIDLKGLPKGWYLVTVDRGHRLDRVKLLKE